MRSDKELSRIQNSILEYIKNEIKCKGRSPVVREIGLAVGLKSSSSVQHHLDILEMSGLIRRDTGKARTIELVDDEFNLARREVVNIPVIGTVTAGEPILASENIDSYFPIPVELMPNVQTFMLKVRGESMINAGIFDKDTVIVQQQSTARNGDIVVALLDDSATVKRFFKENGYIRLQPENDSMSPIIVEKVEILGKVIGLLRLGM